MFITFEQQDGIIIHETKTVKFLFSEYIEYTALHDNDERRISISQIISITEIDPEL